MFNQLRMPSEWSTLKKLIWLRGNPATGQMGTDFTVSGTPPLSLPNSLGKPLKAWSVDLLPYQEGTGDPAPDNVRPIHGTDKLTITTAGKNLFNNAMAFGGGYYDPVNGALIDTSIPYKLHSEFIPVCAGATVIQNNIRAEDVNGNQSVVFSSWTYWDDNYQFVSGIWNRNASDTVPQGAYYLVLSATNNISPENFADFVSDYTLAFGSTATPYTPYIAPSQTVLTLPQTVYTGTIGSEVGESRLRKRVLNGSETWAGSNTSGIYMLLNDMKKFTDYDVSNRMFCENLSVAKNNNNMSDFSITGYADYTSRYPNQNWLYIRIDDEHPDATSVKQWLAQNPVTVVYDIAEPDQLSLTVPPIPTPTGTASTWATAEDGTVESMEVTYVGKA